MSAFLWIILIGFLAGLVARWLSPGPNNPTGFILTAVIGIAGAFLADLDRADDRLVPGRSGARGIHCRDDRGAARAVHLEQAGRPRGHFGPGRAARLSVFPSPASERGEVRETRISP